MPRPALPDVIAARGRSGAAGVPSLSASLVHVTDPSVHRLSTVVVGGHDDALRARLVASGQQAA
jgi:hypothetical protein